MESVFFRRMTDSTEHNGEVDFFCGVLASEADALRSLSRAAAERLGGEITRAVGLLTACASAGGSVLVTGLGKSGLVGAKIAATMSSLGIPSHTVHPAEAAHGDLGRFRPKDVVIAISYSGETDEVIDLCAILRQDGLAIIGICNGPIESGDTPSTLERLATVTIRLGLKAEAGAPRFAAPTSSTTLTMAVGDALALAAAKRCEFSDADFARRHPGGSLGRLLRPVREILRYEVGKGFTGVADTLAVSEALRAAAESGGGRRPGAILLIDAVSGTLSGIFTDGDLRRLVLSDPARLDRPIREVMTRSPRTLNETALVRDAVRMFREHRQDEIPVVDAAHTPVGILDVQDLIAMKLVQD